ncbi:hypothetical protein CDD80_5922 [Ophiocordyceps camponoti-rufipedis]|uniref:DUF4470 domain-containing protein n=1 Tax=Ophiocordyceps camponoti-rufipedis TaxID=2004952 RepID=A0A2C5ZIE2_9HYPO|nr:hypothetical protein CDD80_5922 [Ophiocordyceps camponoti-rufipedis]
MAPPEYLCANLDGDSSECEKKARYTCKNCFLVAHKIDCKSPLIRDDWEPAWVMENRRPAFYDEEKMQYSPPVIKYLWGNIPAIDIVKLEDNEGVDYKQDLRLLFAASGDLRNVVKTIAQLPTGYTHRVHVTINDIDLEIVCRNALFLLIAHAIQDADEAADCIVHLWYSAYLRPSHINILQTRIRPLLKAVCAGISSRAPKSLIGKSWVFGNRSLRLVMRRESWILLLALFHRNHTFTLEEAREIRDGVTANETRVDWQERIFCCQPPKHRLCMQRFRKDGILLPFGASRADFTEPNPTLFLATYWPLLDDADPSSGWYSKDIAETSSGPASSDLYGKLYYHVRETVQAFIGRIAGGQVSFRLLNLDAADLVDHVNGEHFSRIEISNLADTSWLGIHRTLLFMVPLLQSPTLNPHATLITLFMNAVEDTLTGPDKVRKMDASVTARLRSYLKGGRLDKAPTVEIIKTAMAMDIVYSYDDTFDRYASLHNFGQAAAILGTAIKEEHTIVEKWPYKLKLVPGQPKAQEEFTRVLGSWAIGKERYIEWKRII